MILIASGFVLSSVSFAQTAPTPAAPAAPATAASDAKTEAPKVYHAGGKHDQKGHEASEKAKAKGQKMQEPAVHAGGRHDENQHKAAIKAEQTAPAATAAETPAKK
jgi:hypothetical protein